MIANLNTFFKNITKRPFYIFSFLALPFGLYLFDISNKFKNIIEPIEEEIIDEDELMESESKEEEIIDEDELIESESKENESDFGGTYFLSNIPEYPEEESNNENIFSRFVNYIIFQEKV